VAALRTHQAERRAAQAGTIGGQQVAHQQRNLADRALQHGG
jgi:hypothetical protein